MAPYQAVAVPFQAVVAPCQVVAAACQPGVDTCRTGYSSSDAAAASSFAAVVEDSYFLALDIACLVVDAVAGTSYLRGFDQDVVPVGTYPAGLTAVQELLLVLAVVVVAVQVLPGLGTLGMGRSAAVGAASYGPVAAVVDNAVEAYYT